MTESLTFTVGVPVIMDLVVSVILIERIVQITIKPIELGQLTKEPRHLDEFAKFVIIVGADRIKIIV